ncbi:sugar phosphate isomerase/epimerase [Gracilibacillus caseinilyticus]|uniref:Sugar phosphate isomerase/epimerase n=1 Tax=Gracilibacillus caseinilyticus TaxID=2932256 RepID=A0ABY4ET95_9BACI|nr:sugar phosphate isomerase/epimerase family protein [Gracilibacillus caseinilyticus]UOQ47647.1 sugar phosphate isomerase/epimerase [Gracilibacillus caseinilyticus]
MKYAAFSGAFIDYSIQQTMVMTKELGFDGIEIACREPHLSSSTSLPRVEEMKDLADHLGLEIPVLAGYTGHFSTASDQECAKALQEFRQLLKWAEILGADMVRVFPGGPNGFLAEDYHYEKAAFWLNQCVKEAKAFSINVIMEIHNISLIETVEQSKKLINTIGHHENIGLIHDAGNMYITDTDYGRDSILNLGEHLFHFHVKDVKRVGESSSAPGSFTNKTKHGDEQFMLCLLGEGAIEHQPLFDTLCEIEYNGWITLECAAPYPPKDRIEADLKKVQEMVKRNSFS